MSLEYRMYNYVRIFIINNYIKIFDGTTIGRKKIATFDPITTTSIKITITDAKAEVLLKPSAAHDFGFEVKN